jgi:pyruvate/2-oxoglutarate dehydrogenase complex dihydrolipoamide acyltransferase (E2) component
MLMPTLSPSFKLGKITKWYGRKGDFLKANDILFDVTTHSLTNFDSKESSLHVEIQEDMYIAKVIEEAGGKEVHVGAPIAILCEEQNDIDVAEKLIIEDDNKMFEISNKVQVCMWQAFVRSKNDSGACGCS